MDNWDILVLPLPLILRFPTEQASRRSALVAEGDLNCP